MKITVLHEIGCKDSDKSMLGWVMEKEPWVATERLHGLVAVDEGLRDCSGTVPGPVRYSGKPGLQFNRLPELHSPL